MRRALSAIALIGTIASSQAMPRKTVITPGEIETATVTIGRIDVAKRFVVLRGDDGSEMGVFAPPEFPQMGDRVTTTYIEALLATLARAK